MKITNKECTYLRRKPLKKKSREEEKIYYIEKWSTKRRYFSLGGVGDCQPLCYGEIVKNTFVYIENPRDKEEFVLIIQETINKIS